MSLILNIIKYNKYINSINIWIYYKFKYKVLHTDFLSFNNHVGSRVNLTLTDFFLPQTPNSYS